MSENPPATEAEAPSTTEAEAPSVSSPDLGDIKLIPRYDDHIDHPNCLVVAPYRLSEEGPTIMATVEHYYENKESAGFPWTILQVTEKALLLKAAVDKAVEYAKANDVPVILLNVDGFSTATERRQTDTERVKI
jgi:hypothetical protein